MSKPAPPIDPSVARKNPDLALPFLAHHLRQGSLGLAIGAGASRYLNLPDWKLLVKTCSQKAGMKWDLGCKPSTAQLCHRMEEIEAKLSGRGHAQKGESGKYRSLVADALYRGVDYDDILRGDLLMGLGALLIGSRRGSVTEVLNFNFDDVLEWYLYLHGYETEVVTHLPALRTSADVTIYHPHGFLPRNDTVFRKSNFLIFSQQSYDAKMGDLVEPWSDLTRTFLKSKVVLFVGLSGDDPTFGPIFQNVQTALGSSRVTGVWLFTKRAAKGKLNSLEARNLVVLELSDHDEWPNYLLRICQTAAQA